MTRFLRVSIVLIAAARLAASCGDKSFSPGTAEAKPADGAKQLAEMEKAQSEKEVGDPKKALENLSQELLDKLKTDQDRRGSGRDRGRDLGRLAGLRQSARSTS